MKNYRYEFDGVIRDLKSNIIYDIDDIVDLLEEKDMRIAKLKKQLADKKIEYKKLKILFDIVNNPKKDAMLKQIQGLQKQLKNQPAEIVEKIKKQLVKRLNTISGYGRMTTDELSFFIESEFSSDLNTILKEYGGKDE